MRADRLVALLLLLQQRTRLTAAEAAAELEVSERTARRDLEALGMAGVPVYSERGRGGGWRLVGGSRTDLSGLNAAEARALFLVAGSAPAATPELKAALRKLVRALPEPLRVSAEASSKSVVIDPGGWGERRTHNRPVHLDSLQSAVVDQAQVRLAYRDRSGEESVRVVDPLGVALKGTVWYLVAGTNAGLRTFRVGRVSSVERTGEAVVRPEGFDLAETWHRIVEQVDELRSPAAVLLRADPDVLPILRWMFENQVDVGEPGSDGRLSVTVRGPHAETVAAQLAGFGARIEITEPLAVRQQLADLGGELIALYSTPAIRRSSNRSRLNLHSQESR